MTLAGTGVRPAVVLQLNGPWYRLELARAGERYPGDGAEPASGTEFGAGRPDSGMGPDRLLAVGGEQGQGLRRDSFRSSSGLWYTILSRGGSLLAELGQSWSPAGRAGPASESGHGGRTDHELLEAIYWNDALAFSFDPGEDAWSIWTNRCCSLPALWRKEGSRIAISNRVVPELLSSARCPAAGTGSGGLRLDPVGWAEALVFDFPLRGRTVLEGIQQIPPGHRLKVSRAGLELHRYASLRLSGETRGDEGELASHAAALHRQGVARSVAVDGPILLPLSGGIDSRGIAGYLGQAERSRTTVVSFGHARSRELRLASRVARTLGLPWQSYLLDREHYLADYASFYAASGGMSHLLHVHILRALASLPGAERGQALIGFMGDPAAGAACGRDPHDAGGRGSAKGGHDHGLGHFEKAAARLLASHGHTVAGLRRLFGESIQGRLLEDVRELYNECLLENSPAELPEYVFCVERQAKLIAHVFNLVPAVAGSVAFPYLDGEWARFFHALHPKHRAGRRICRISMLAGLPELAAAVPCVPPIAMPDPGRWNASWGGARERSLRRLQSVIEVVSGGRWTLPNPYQTENPPAVVNRFLRPALGRAVELLRAEGLISAPMAAHLSRPHYSARGVQGAFRVISHFQLLGSIPQEPALPPGGAVALERVEPRAPER